MSIHNLARYGTIEAPAIARAQYRESVAAARRQDAVHRTAARSALPTARIPAAEFTRLRRLALVGATANGTVNATFFSHAEDGDSVVVRFRPAVAGEIAAWLRRPEIGFRGDALDTLDAHAPAAPAPAASITMDPAERRDIMRILDSVASLDIRDASPAADFLRATKITDGVVVIPVTPAQAVRLAAVFVAVRARADLITELNRIAGRAAAGQH